jgi:hypothetical protein
VDNGIVIYPEQVGESQVCAIFKPTGEATNIIRFAANYCINFVNIDKPDDRIQVALEAHANDNGDKAPGKAVTYATKTAILKVLCLETGENDESRTEADNIEDELELIANCGSLEELKIVFSKSFEKHRANTKLMAQLSKAKDDAKHRMSVG